ncbi:TRAFFICKING PROTEIN PARTICLE COMPLEX SUBUNIT 9 [Salix purpurea]|uniref:TRAFFICKING PROTEIN PARTICLE COMPLEX SUBUNIT 9 n=1 Tax=Salix purpurea TaxID=77065 RepID=A0A9Q0T217_SALPP|nr:TRAFFICKING PROTEIN PARTICLE COMPLEX SUBUNIT 9 [Salix purpurea]
MEPDVSIETSSMIRIAILPIGEIPHQTLRDYYSMFHHHHPIPLSSISSFYTEEQKSPFTSLPWDTGSLRFKFILGGSPPSPWEDFQSNRKILAVIGVFHCPLSPDLDSVIEEFDGVCKGYASALVTRCFGFFPCDSQVIKAKKRRLGRVQKTIGDYCLLAGSPVDANAHYSTALELARLTTDYFWYAGALEGSICALLIDQIGQNNPALEDEVRVSPLSFELEANLKLARYLCRRELSRDIVELLTSAADGAKSLIDATDRLVLYVEIARLFGTLGYHRKAAFFSRQVAQLCLQQDNRLAAISALQILALTTKAYCVQSRASISNNSHINEVGSRNADSGKMHHQSVVSLFESQWSMLQMVVLRDILLSAARAGDPLAAWSAAARLLRSYYPLITPVGQNGLARALANSSERLPSGTRCSDPALPFVRLYSFPQHSSQMDIVKRNPAREDWWAGSAPSGPFIYKPFSKGQPNDSSKKELIWIVGEPVQILVELANPCGFNLKVDSIYLSVHSGNLDPFPISIDLPPHSSKVVTLSGIPTSVGPVTIPGCTVHCFGVITEHLFRDVDNLLHGAAEGLVLSDPFRSCGSPSLANAGTVPVEQAHISLSGKNQDSVLSIPYETLKSVLPLKPGGRGDPTCDLESLEAQVSGP